MTKFVEKQYTLSRFSMRPAPHRIGQRAALDWLAGAHARAEATRLSLTAAETDAFEARIRRVIDRCGCGPDKISSRGHVLPEVGRSDWTGASLYDVARSPHGRGTAERTRRFGGVVNAYFEAEYAEEEDAPSDLIHVTCTGYVSPSGAQRMIANKGWGERTRVIHAYHMGCYAAFPAARMAAGLTSAPRALHAPGRRVDIVHTELCSLHVDPGDHSVEALVVQSLFADGFIRYSLVEDEAERGLRVLSLHELVLPGSADAMSWVLSDWGMHMTLARSVPESIQAGLRRFVETLYDKAGLALAQNLSKSVFAVHPGGPKIIDGVRAALELDESQVKTSRDVLFDHGNMSSATLPHVWMRLVADARVAPGTLVASFAFGPGLTVSGGLFRKC